MSGWESLVIDEGLLPLQLLTFPGAISDDIGSVLKAVPPSESAISRSRRCNVFLVRAHPRDPDEITSAVQHRRRHEVSAGMCSGAGTTSSSVTQASSSRSCRDWQSAEVGAVLRSV